MKNMTFCSKLTATAIILALIAVPTVAFAQPANTVVPSPHEIIAHTF